jgi:hypothetical protein
MQFYDGFAAKSDLFSRPAVFRRWRAALRFALDAENLYGFINAMRDQQKLTAVAPQIPG